jgi:hypothetical protein
LARDSKIQRWRKAAPFRVIPSGTLNRRRPLTFLLLTFAQHSNLFSRFESRGQIM